MPKVAARDFERTFAGAARESRICLFHGDNDDLKSDLFKAVCNLVDVKPDDPFRFARLEGETLDLDGGRLADELGAISMFGGSRLIQVRASAREAERVLEQALAAPTGDWVLALECPDLSETEGFASITREPGAICVSCGSEDAGDFRSFVVSEMAKMAVSAEDAAIERLISLVGDDRGAVRSEIAKLSALIGSSRAVMDQDVKEIVADASSMLADEVATAAFNGDCDGLARALDRMALTGVDPVQALGAAHRLSLNLHRARAKNWGSRGDKHAPVWSAGDLRSLMRALGAAVGQTRRDSAAAALAAERALAVLGNTARARRR